MSTNHNTDNLRKVASKLPDSVWSVILAGGSGTRLWPLSRQSFPKQFIKFSDSDQSLLEQTISRLEPVAQGNTLIVTNEVFKNTTGHQHAHEILTEPVARNTAPAIAIAACHLQLMNDEADPIMVVSPADHLVQDDEAFQQALASAIDLAQNGEVVLLGIEPSSPNTGYGYIEAGMTIEGCQQANRVKRFVEKPALGTAEAYLKAGNYYWNSGIFVWKASTILALVEAHLPIVSEIIGQMIDQYNEGASFQNVIDANFSKMDSVSIDYGVLEPASKSGAHLAVVPCDIGWSDIGSWDALYNVSTPDGDGVVAHGDVCTEDCSNSYFKSEHRLVAAIGVSNVCLVETRDAILLTTIGDTQRVKTIVDKLKIKNAKEVTHHLTDSRPWGSYTILEEYDGFKIKRITVDSGGSLSLQSHQHRSEHWVIVSGTATVECDGKVQTVMKNQSVYIPVGSTHRLENKGKIPLQLIEVQVGEYLGEDDIERFDDRYGRSKVS